MAIKYYNLAIEQGNEKAIFNLGYLYHENDEDDLALEVWKKLSLIEDSDLCIFLAEIYHRKDDFGKCEEYLKLARENSTAYYLLGDLYREYHDCELSEKYFLLGAESDDVDCQIELHKLYEQQNKLELSEKYLKLLVGNSQLKYVYDFAEKCMKKEEYSRAINYYKMLENKKLNFYTWCDKEEKIKYNLCKAYLKLKNYEEAEKYLIVMEESKVFEYTYEIAKIYEENNKFNEAEKYYLLSLDYVKSLEPLDYLIMEREVCFNLGKLYLKLNEIENAKKYLKYAIEDDYMSDEYNSEIKYLLGEIYEKEGNFELTKKYYLESNIEKAKIRLNLINKNMI